MSAEDAATRSGRPRAFPGAIDRRFAAWSILWTAAALLGFGLISAIIPNPVFGRQIPPEPFAIALWLVSGPLMGLVAATYTAPAAPTAPGTPAGLLGSAPVSSPPGEEARGSTLGTLAGIGVFLAIGCPVCNKIALVLLGTSGALSVFAPIQPVLGALSLGLLAATLAWRLRQRARGAACPV